MQDVIDTFPFRNTIEVVTLKGDIIWQVMEKSVEKFRTNEPHGRFLQVSGKKFGHCLLDLVIFVIRVKLN